MPETKYQEDIASDVICSTCKHNRRISVDGDAWHCECVCDVDNSHINTIQCIDEYCDKWEDGGLL